VCTLHRAMFSINGTENDSVGFIKNTLKRKE
jgi:hypothetical protein